MNSQKQGFPLRLCWKDRTNRWGRDVLVVGQDSRGGMVASKGRKKTWSQWRFIEVIRGYFLCGKRGLESSQERWLSMCCLDVLLFGGLSLFWQVNSYHMNHMKHKYIWMYLRGCFFFVQPSWIKSRKSKKDRWYANTQSFTRFCWMYAIATPLKQAACWTDLIQNWIWGNFSGRTIRFCRWTINMQSQKLLLMEEILHHLECKKPCKQ